MEITNVDHQWEDNRHKYLVKGDRKKMPLSPQTGKYFCYFKSRTTTTAFPRPWQLSHSSLRITTIKKAAAAAEENDWDHDLTSDTCTDSLKAKELRWMEKSGASSSTEKRAQHRQRRP